MLTSVPKGSLAMAVAVWTRWDLSLVPAALAWSWGLMGNSVTAGGNHQSSGNVWRLTGITQESPAKEWHWVSCQSRSFWECFPLGWGISLKLSYKFPQIPCSLPQYFPFSLILCFFPLFSKDRIILFLISLAYFSASASYVIMVHQEFIFLLISYPAFLSVTSVFHIYTSADEFCCVQSSTMLTVFFKLRTINLKWLNIMARQIYSIRLCLLSSSSKWMFNTFSFSPIFKSDPLSPLSFSCLLHFQ